MILEIYFWIVVILGFAIVVLILGGIQGVVRLFKKLLPSKQQNPFTPDEKLGPPRNPWSNAASYGPNSDYRFCNWCGKAVHPIARFCSACGRGLPTR
jgi:hypothetical protein